MFLCHCFPFSWQREESQGRACQCESSLKVWRLQLDIASGLTPKDKDNTHPSVKMCQTTHRHTRTHRHTHIQRVSTSLFYMECMLIPQLFAPHPSSPAATGRIINKQNLSCPISSIRNLLRQVNSLLMYVSNYQAQSRWFRSLFALSLKM